VKEIKMKEKTESRSEKKAEVVGTGKKYRMVERSYAGEKKVVSIELKVAYIGEINFLGKIYDLFAHKGQEEGFERGYLPSAGRFEEYYHGTIVGIDAFEKGSLKIKENKIITSPDNPKISIGLEYRSRIPSRDSDKICKTLLKILEND